MRVARLEQLLRGLYQGMLEARGARWAATRAECKARIEELAEVGEGGGGALARCSGGGSSCPGWL